MRVDCSWLGVGSWSWGESVVLLETFLVSLAPPQAPERWGATFLRLGHRQLLMGPPSPASLFPASILPTAKALGF